MKPPSPSALKKKRVVVHRAIWDIVHDLAGALCKKTGYIIVNWDDKSMTCKNCLRKRGGAIVKSLIVDLDGTLANVDHRTHFVKRVDPQWDDFYSACDKDVPNLWCVILMDTFRRRGFPVMIVSARRDTEKDKTLKWLADYGVPYDQLIMLRKGNENTPDTALKKTWLDGFGRDNVLFVVDDRQKVVDMWREEGVVCLQCYAWPEFK